MTELTTDIPRLMSTSRAAKILCLSPRTLEKMRVRGDGPQFVQLGRAVRYEFDALLTWINSNRKNSTSDHHDV